MTYIVLTVKLIVFTAALLILLVGILKLTENKVKSFSKGKYIKILEKTDLSKNNSVYLLKLGEEGVVVVTNDKGASTIKELTAEEIKVIEKEKEEKIKEFNELYNGKIINLKNSGLNLVNRVREVKNEK
ncbi:MAG: flagellar biosynthetic protein FliO [Sarcina sp.]